MHCAIYFHVSVNYGYVTGVGIFDLDISLFLCIHGPVSRVEIFDVNVCALCSVRLCLNASMIKHT